jgi:hypothetical protein
LNATRGEEGVAGVHFGTWIAELDPGAALGELVGYSHTWALSPIAASLLVGEPEQEHFAAAETLALLVQQRRDPGLCVVGHVFVDLVRQLDESERSHG